MKKLTNLLRIFLLYAKIGATTFGGGYSMLPILRHELVDKRAWLTDEELADCFALAQCLPGMIAVNCAVLVLRPRQGRAAACCAVAGVVLPSLLIILLLATVLVSYAHLPAIAHAFAGVRVAVAATIIYSAWKLLKVGVHGVATGSIAALAFLLLLLSDLNPVFVVIAGALAGLLAHQLRSRKGAGK